MYWLSTRQSQHTASFDGLVFGGSRCRRRIKKERKAASWIINEFLSAFKEKIEIVDVFFSSVALDKLLLSMNMCIRLRKESAFSMKFFYRDEKTSTLKFHWVMIASWEENVSSCFFSISYSFSVVPILYCLSWARRADQQDGESFHSFRASKSVDPNF